ncbi:MAG: hypothetical protein HYV59_00680 [Planctomycetes bacterium]|nr:hypothetical protein [Planctomycetota bacterium]
MSELSKIIYSLNIEDAQNVAKEELGRKLTKKELKIVEDQVGNYIDWYQVIDFAIQDALENLKKAKTK